jgi:hypothetical protein
MPTRDDYLLRMIEQAFAVLRRILRRSTEAEVPEVLREIDTALHELLGPSAEVLQRLDAATAVPLLADPARAAVWARLLAERASLLRRAGDAAGAHAAERRGREVALEAWALEREQPRLNEELKAALRESLEMTAGVDDASLSPRHRTLLGEVAG